MTDSSDPPDITSSPSLVAPAARDTRSDASTPSNNPPPNHLLGEEQKRHAQHSNQALKSSSATGPDADPGQDLDKPAAKPDGGDPPPPSLRLPIQPNRRTAAPYTSTDSDQNIIGAPVSQDESTGVVLEKNTNRGSDDTTQDSLAPGASPTKFQRIVAETRRSAWLIITHTWLNALLVFIPVGIIAAEIPGIHGGVVFATNAVAIIPLAGLLAFATESVAAKMGDALGALLNVTFGNAVELIIFIIALAQNKIRIVQASLLGSILANLLLILGMGFFLGGLRYREQVYNSTVTQMSACLLSLSVISLVLPTAFHASFSDPHKADAESLKISRGTSVILLLVYGIYLLFQLKSHAYLYESTPQHIVDAEAVPGPAAGWLDSSSDDSSSSSSSDSSDSDHSRDTMKRKMKKVLRGGRRRKSSVTSVEMGNMRFNKNRSSSFLSVDTNAIDEQGSVASSSGPRPLQAGEGQYDTADEDGSYRKKRRFSRKKHKKDKKRRAREERAAAIPGQSSSGHAEGTTAPANRNGEPRRVDFAMPAQDTNQSTEATDGTPTTGARRPFPALRGMSVKNLAPPVFVPASTEPVAAQSGPVPRVRYGIRRTNSLPDRLRQQQQQQQQYPYRPPGAMLPAQVPLMSLTGGNGAQEAAAGDELVDNGHLTKWASIVLLLISTGLVAFCAELLVSSIEDVTSSSSVGEIFIGLIILPIVGNAAEHVTAITVAMKNKMDLAIGVAVGSSIQIAIFITPLVVILGWIMEKEMTLYFTLFETVCLFVSAFMVNFLVLDGRSNYLEGALLCAVYLIISVVAFFYPDGDEASQWGD